MFTERRGGLELLPGGSELRNSLSPRALARRKRLANDLPGPRRQLGGADGIWGRLSGVVFAHELLHVESGPPSSPWWWQLSQEAGEGAGDSN